MDEDELSSSETEFSDANNNTVRGECVCKKTGCDPMKKQCKCVKQR